jgi:hypothetical protein
VSDMIVADIMEEEAAHPSKKWAVDCSSSTTKEGPFALPVVWNRWVRVMQKGKHNDPVVNKLADFFV